MQRMTIDFGIDLGTTNSAISVMDKGVVEVIKDQGREVLPSAVYIDKKGTRHVGEAAKGNWAQLKKMNDCAMEFKRLMGTDVVAKFSSANLALLPEELSAVVLSKLRSLAGQRFNSDSPAAAVITIPAMFESAQRGATAEAGKLAGFSHVELLQEPVAAAMAYGFKGDLDNQFWLVYDFGGGTFDASIIAVRDGEISVIEHAGNNYLGGSDLDWAVVEKLLLPKLSESADVSHLSRAAMEGDDVIKSSMRKLKLIAEGIKKNLSSQNSIDCLEDDVFVDKNGEFHDLDCSISRSEYEQVIANLVDQSITIVQQLLKSTGIDPGSIAKVVMVGGTTFVPLVRRRVEELGIEVDYSMDPMTVVSEGAAVYAASRRMPDGLDSSAPVTSGLKLDLEYNPVSRDTESLVMGRLQSADGSALPGDLHVEISRSDGEWSSGQLPVDQSGMFTSNVTVDKGKANHYEIKSFVQSDRVDLAPSEFTITYGVSMESATLPASLRLELADGTTKLIIGRGASLPASTTKPIPVVTVRELVAGSSDSLLIPYADGEDPRADRCRRGGAIKIVGTDIERSLPAGKELQVTASVDVSGVMTCEAFVEFLDDTFQSTREVLQIDGDQLQSDFDSLGSRLDELIVKADAASDADSKRQLDAIRTGGRIDDVQRELDATKSTGDGGAARNMIISIHSELDTIEGRVEWPTTHTEYLEMVESARRMLHDDPEAQKLLEQIEKEGQRAVDEKDPPMLVTVMDAIRSLMAQFMFKQPDYWYATLAHLSQNMHEFSDRSAAESILQQGARAMQAKDVATVQSCVRELWSMLPEDVVAESKQASGVI